MLLLRLLAIPSLMQELWGSWRFDLRFPLLEIEVLLICVITWNIWLTQNDHIFNDKYMSLSSIIRKIDHMLLLWFSAAPEGKRRSLISPLRLFDAVWSFWNCIHSQPAQLLPVMRLPLKAQTSVGIVFLLIP